MLRTSSFLGKICVQNLPERVQKPVAEKLGFAKFELSFVVASPATMKLAVVMK